LVTDNNPYPLHCAVCGHIVPQEAYAHCHHCSWIQENERTPNANSSMHINDVTLEEARINYKLMGKIHKKYVGHNADDGMC